MSLFARLSLAAASGVVLLAVVDSLVVTRLSPDARSWYVAAVRIALYGLASLAAGIAAATFSWWREHIGRAWMFFSLEFLLLLVNYILRRTAPNAQIALDVTLVAANVAQIAAYWTMARVLHAAGIGYLMGQGKKIGLTVAALLVAVVLCQAPLMAQWDLIRAGQVRVGSLVSVLADVITFTLVAPLTMSTLALLGGQLAWIFGFLTISVFGWMVNSAAPAIATLLGGGADETRTFRMIGVAIAALFNAAAAGAQSLTARETMKGGDADG